ncbi:MAG: cupin domain-containing protein [Candidatus Eisenbacteria bacterium]|nr:cupin domain-containing protein [Candidatus Eisenbacteria bacterium]
MRYTRVFADELGESHFEDIEVGMDEVVFAPPAPPLKLSEFMESSRFSFLSADPGWYGDWHPAPKRQFTLYLQGEVEAGVSDGEIRRFGPGSAVLVEDTTGKGHRSKVLGDQEMVLAVVQLDP